ncbi:MAG: MFS transporter [Bauldia sp.]|nr:MFS transporter [Bauldia sp.]
MTAATADDGPLATRRNWLGLAVIALPCLLYSMDLTVLNLAVPQLAEDLVPTAAELLWIVDIYGFFLAGALITMGTLGDRIGRRKLLMIGAAAFGAASVIAAFSTTAPMLIAARALLGLAGATLAPSTLSLIRSMFLNGRQRSFAIGVWIACFAAGAAIGPLVGGVLLEHFWWGSVFLIAVPVMLLLLVLVPLLLPEFRDPNASRLDIPSAVLSMAAVLAVIYGVKRIAEGDALAVPITIILAGIGLGVVFIARQLRLDDPLIDVRLLRHGPMTAALLTNMIALFVPFGTFFFVSQYLQLVLGLGPLEAGLWMLPTGIALFAGSLASPFLARRFGRTAVIVSAFLGAAIGFVLLAQLGPGAGSLPLVVTGVFIVALSLAPIPPITTDVVVGVTPVERAGAASAISETSFELGAALGIAVLGSIVAAFYRSAFLATAGANLPPDAVADARGTLGGALAIAETLPEPARTQLAATARDAFSAGFAATALVCIGLSLAGAVLALTALRTRSA